METSPNHHHIQNSPQAARMWTNVPSESHSRMLPQDACPLALPGCYHRPAQGQLLSIMEHSCEAHGDIAGFLPELWVSSSSRASLSCFSPWRDEGTLPSLALSSLYNSYKSVHSTLMPGTLRGLNKRMTNKWLLLWHGAEGRMNWTLAPCPGVFLAGGRPRDPFGISERLHSPLAQVTDGLGTGENERCPWGIMETGKAS